MIASMRVVWPILCGYYANRNKELRAEATQHSDPQNTHTYHANVPQSTPMAQRTNYRVNDERATLKVQRAQHPPINVNRVTFAKIPRFLFLPRKRHTEACVVKPFVLQSYRTLTCPKPSPRKKLKRFAACSHYSTPKAQ
jgi:hypothetical protein